MFAVDLPNSIERARPTPAAYLLADHRLVHAVIALSMSMIGKGAAAFSAAQFHAGRMRLRRTLLPLVVGLCAIAAGPAVLAAGTAGQGKAQSCLACHGARVGGGVAAMADVAYSLSDADILALAHFLSRL